MSDRIRGIDVLFILFSRFFTYYSLNGQTFGGSVVDNEACPGVKSEAWEDFMQTRSLEGLSNAYFALSQ